MIAKSEQGKEARAELAQGNNKRTDPGHDSIYKLDSPHTMVSEADGEQRPGYDGSSFCDVGLSRHAARRGRNKGHKSVKHVSADRGIEPDNGN